MEKIYYYKTREDIVRYGTSSNEIFEDDPQCIPISEEEYNYAIAELEEIAKIEAERIELEELSRIEALEKENAALLFQILTGEEYTDV